MVGAYRPADTSDVRSPEQGGGIGAACARASTGPSAALCTPIPFPVPFTQQVQVLGADLADDLVHFCGHAAMYAARRRELERGVVGLGGRVAQNLVPRVSLLLAGERKDSGSARVELPLCLLGM